MKPPSRYKKFLSKDETVNGKYTKFVFHIKNIGDELVPQGHVEIVLEKLVGMGTFSRTPPLAEMPAIEPNKTFSLKKEIDLTLPGLWFITLRVKLKDKKKIEYYQFEGGNPDFDKWMYPLYAVDRHQLDLISLVERLMKKKVE